MIGITFATNDYEVSARKCTHSMIENGCDWHELFDGYDIEPLYYIFGKDFFNNRGFGFWSWKAYLILKTLRKANENEIIVYSDAGVEVIDNLNYIVDRMDQDIFLFGNMWTARHWTKGDIYKAIGVEPDESKQVQASVIFVRNTQFARDFIKEWLLYCLTPGLIDDSPSKTPNDPEFQENRHDQAILHVLSQKHGIKKHWWPASYNNGAFIYEKGDYKDDYPVLFSHHRKTNDQWEQ